MSSRSRRHGLGRALILACPLIVAACTSGSVPSASPSLNSSTTPQASAATSASLPETTSTTIDTASSEPPVSHKLEEELVCAVPDFPITLDGVWPVGSGRLIGLTRTIDITITSDAVIYPQRAQVTYDVEVRSLGEDSDGWLLSWRDMVGSHLSSYGAHLPKGASDGLTGEEYVEIFYHVGRDGRISLQSTADEIAAHYQELRNLLIGDANSGYFDQGPEVVVPIVGFDIVDPAGAFDRVLESVSVYHLAFARDVQSVAGQTQEGGWLLPLSNRLLALETTTTPGISPNGCFYSEETAKLPQSYVAETLSLLLGGLSEDQAQQFNSSVKRILSVDPHTGVPQRGGQFLRFAFEDQLFVHSEFGFQDDGPLDPVEQ